MFGDAGRARNAVLTVLVLAALGGWYAKLAMELEIGWRACMEDPAGWDGQELVFPLWVVTGVEGPNRYRISKVVRDIPIEGNAEGLKEGDTVSVIGNFRADRTVVEQTVLEVHHLRKWKEGLGVLGLLAWLVSMPFLFRWRGGRLWERADG